MAISVNYLRERVRSLASKGQAGYTTNQDFNLGLQSAVWTLFEYWTKQFEQTRRIADALQEFINRTTITTTNGNANLPDDYVHELETWVKWIDNQCKNGPDIQFCPADYMNTDEVAKTLKSNIRKPSVDKGIFRFTIDGGKFYGYPENVTEWEFKYLAKPNIPKNNGIPNYYVTTLQSNPQGDFEQFDATNSTDIPFPEHQTENFVDLLLFYLGIEIKDNAIVQYAQLKSTEATTTTPQGE